MLRLGRHKRLIILIISILFLCNTFSLTYAETEDVVVANSKDWRSLYVAGVYSSLTDSKLIYISDLFSAKEKTGMMDKEDNILVLESRNNYVVRNYESFLEKNDYNNVNTEFFQDYSELQTILFEDLEMKGLFILNPDYGSVAVVSVPYIIKNKYLPFFINSENKEEAESLASGKDTVISGRIPEEYIENIEGERFVDSPFNVVSEIIELVTENTDKEWGLIVKADEIEPSTLRTTRPIFLYMGEKYFSNLVDSVENSGLENFEAIGASMNEVAKRVDDSINKDLKMMLKYGRMISKGKGFQTEIETLEMIPFDFPYEQLIVTKSVYYPNLNRLGLTFKNEGNIDLMFFSTVEFLDDSFSEENIHHILAGQTKTIPFEFSGDFDGKNVKASTQYACAFPLKNLIPGAEEENLYYSFETSEDSHNEDKVNVSVEEYGYDFEKDRLVIEFNNPSNNEMLIFAELEIDDKNIRTSKLGRIPARDTAPIIIETPYTGTEDIAYNTFNVTTYFGEKDTLNIKTFELEMKEYPQSEDLTYIIAVAVLIIVIFLILLFIKKKKKDEEKETKKSKKVKKK